MAKLDQILKELFSLVTKGADLLQEGQKKDVSLGTFGPRYEAWYTKALSVVSAIIPERALDFREAYRADRRKDITYATYTISDYLTGLVVKYAGQPTFDTSQAFGYKMLRQIGIVQAALEAAPLALRDIRTVFRAELLDADIHTARELLRSGHLRAAGAICGVVLESHLGSVATRHAVSLYKKNLTISDFNDALKDANVYNVPLWPLFNVLAIYETSAHMQRIGTQQKGKWTI